jgi:3-hydroxymyristoyl/3-hydroxydecanoyl-(acyl carrier protein) dehydratase
MINPQSVFTFTESQKMKNADGEILVTWSVPENLPYFEGHFPGNPILPGVALLDLIQVLLDGQFQLIKSAKFTEIIRPLDTLTIKAKLDPSNNFWSVQVFNQNDVSVCKTVLQLT